MKLIFGYWLRVFGRAFRDAFKFADSWGINLKKAIFPLLVLLVVAGFFVFYALPDMSIVDKLIWGSVTFFSAASMFVIIFLCFVLRTPALLEQEATESAKKKHLEELASAQEKLDSANREVLLLNESNAKLAAKSADPAEIKEFLYKVGLHGRKILHSGRPNQKEFVDKAFEIVRKALRYRSANIFESECSGRGLREVCEWLVQQPLSIQPDEYQPSFRTETERRNYKTDWLNTYVTFGNELRDKTKGRTMHSNDISQDMKDWDATVVEFLEIHIPELAATFLNESVIVETRAGGTSTSQLTQRMDKRMHRLNEIIKHVLNK